MDIIVPVTIPSTLDGYNHLISLYYQLQDSNKTNATLDFEYTNWFEANLTSVLGAIVSYFKDQERIIEFKNLSPILNNVFERNGFLESFGGIKIPDNNDTIISYKKYTPYADIEFIDYIQAELLSKPDFPKHSRLLGKKITESIFELFENARTHGQCKYIFTCGQYYPRPKKLDFTIVDLGITIKSNVSTYLQVELSGHEAIDWAMKYGNTTKTGEVSGGLGLDIIFEFVKLNNGKIQIVSSDGYWEFRNGETQFVSLPKPFLGTIVNIEFNLDDNASYVLKQEVSLDNIF